MLFRSSRIVEAAPGLDLESAGMGVFGKVEKSPKTRVLADGERVEIWMKENPRPDAAPEWRRAIVAGEKIDCRHAVEGFAQTPCLPECFRGVRAGQLPQHRCAVGDQAPVGYLVVRAQREADAAFPGGTGESLAALDARVWGLVEALRARHAGLFRGGQRGL